MPHFLGVSFQMKKFLEACHAMIAGLRISFNSKPDLYWYDLYSGIPRLFESSCRALECGSHIGIGIICIGNSVDRLHGITGNANVDALMHWRAVDASNFIASFFGHHHDH